MTGHRDSRFLLIMTAAFMLAHYCRTPCAEELGRLFTTPEERSLLEQLRNPPAETSQAPPADDPARAERESLNNDVTVKGLVYRKNGRGTIWINSSHMRAQQLQINADGNDAGDVQIKIPDSKSVIRFRPAKVHHPHITE